MNNFLIMFLALNKAGTFNQSPLHNWFGGSLP